MKALKLFVDRENNLNELFKRPLISLDNPKDRQDIADSISCGLSPENLHCDGEASPAQVRAKSKMLNAAWKELSELDPTVKFNY